MLFCCSTLETGTRCWISNPGLDPPRELSETASQRGGTLAGNQHGQSLDCEVPPGEGIHSAYQWDGEQLDHSPPTPKLPRYDSGIVIDTQLYVNFSKTGNKDDDYVQGIGQMCPVGMDSAGFKDSGRWDGMSYHVV